MTFSVDELIQIRDLPDFLRAEHCYNDMQHAMLVILFRHGLTALRQGKPDLANRLVDNISLYLYIHFLNEEEGMAYKASLDLLDRKRLAEHSEQHISFLDHWRDNILLPYKRQNMDDQGMIAELSDFYNLVIKHIDGEDLPTYGADATTARQTQAELARLAQTNMPMSPFMTGAFQALHVLDKDVAAVLDQRLLSPQALRPMASLDLVPGVGRILQGSVGSLRDRFAATAGHDCGAAGSGTRIYTH